MLSEPNELSEPRCLGAAGKLPWLRSSGQRMGVCGPSHQPTSGPEERLQRLAWSCTAYRQDWPLPPIPLSGLAFRATTQRVYRPRPLLGRVGSGAEPIRTGSRIASCLLSEMVRFAGPSKRSRTGRERRSSQLDFRRSALSTLDHGELPDCRREVRGRATILVSFCACAVFAPAPLA